MIWLYRLLFPLVALVLAPKQIARMRKRGGYEKDWQHRFGCMGALPEKKNSRVWLQAVSVGEALAAGPLVKALSGKGYEVVFTTTTSTGYSLARERYADDCVTILQFPLDWWPFSARAWRAIAPDACVLMESELWPEHLQQATKRGVSVCLVNARISDKSFKSYQKHPKLANTLLPKLSRVLASSRQSEARFARLGLSEAKLTYTGNLKCDVSVSPLLDEDVLLSLKASMGFAKEDMVLLGSSTWPEEEALLVEFLREARDAGIPLRLLIVPRHAERREEIRELVAESGYSYHFRSEQPEAATGTDIYIGDTTGELAQLSQVADLAFVGKSLPPNDGGQTPIELAALGVPTVYGPCMSNFKDVCASLEESGAVVKCEDASGVQVALMELLQDATRRDALANAARSWHQDNQGALARTVEELEAILSAQC